MHRDESLDDRSESAMRWGAVLAGALLTVALLVVLVVLGLSIGLSLPLEDAEIDVLPGPVLAIGIPATVVVVGLACFLGAWVASRAARPRFGFEAVLHGLAVWGLVALAVGVGLVRFAGSISELVARAGIGATTAVTLTSVMKEIGDLDPRIVTDMDLLKGKAVTRFEMNEPKAPMAKRVKKQVEQDVEQVAEDPELSEELEDTARSGRRALAPVAWTLFGALAAGAVCAAWGGLRGAGLRTSGLRPRA
jgi:hypothetical protein